MDCQIGDRMNEVIEVIEIFAELAKEEIKEMADAAMLELGYTKQWVNRSRAQKNRWARERAAIPTAA